MTKTFSDDTFIIYYRSTRNEILPTPELNDDVYRGEMLVAYDMDTQTVSMYDYNTKTWIEQ